MAAIRLSVWLFWFCAAAFIGVPDRMIALAVDPGAMNFSLLVISTVFTLSFLFLVPSKL